MSSILTNKKDPPKNYLVTLENSSVMDCMYISILQFILESFLYHPLLSKLKLNFRCFQHHVPKNHPYKYDM